jgi:hypothetical protein
MAFEPEFLLLRLFCYWYIPGHIVSTPAVCYSSSGTLELVNLYLGYEGLWL